MVAFFLTMLERDDRLHERPVELVPLRRGLLVPPGRRSFGQEGGHPEERG